MAWLWRCDLLLDSIKNDFIRRCGACNNFTKKRTGWYVFSIIFPRSSPDLRSCSATTENNLLFYVARNWIIHLFVSLCVKKANASLWIKKSVTRLGSSTQVDWSFFTLHPVSRREYETTQLGEKKMSCPNKPTIFSYFCWRDELGTKSAYVGVLRALSIFFWEWVTNSQCHLAYSAGKYRM